MNIVAFIEAVVRKAKADCLIVQGREQDLRNMIKEELAKVTKGEKDAA
jgi:hypothetical protein